LVGAIVLGATAMRLAQLAMSALAVGALFAAADVRAQSPAIILGVPVPDRVAGLPHLALIDFETKNPDMATALLF
jgi:hypothetical protein